MAVDELEDGDDGPLYECLTGAVEIKVNISSKKRQIFVSPSEIKVIPDGTFIRIDTQKSNIRSLLTVLCDVKRSDVHKVMNCTNVVHKIACVKTEQRRKSVDCKPDNQGYHRCRTKKATLAVLQLQPVQTIRSPDVNTVPGIEMRVNHGDHRKRKWIVGGTAFSELGEYRSTDGCTIHRGWRHQGEES